MTPPRAVWRVRVPTPKPLPPSLGGLLEEGTDAIPVRITIVQDDVTTGWDDGALGFEADAVWFSGRATSFRLAAPDILSGAYLLSRREAVTSGEALNRGIPLRHPTREVWVRVQVLTEEMEGNAEHKARLVAEIKRLRAAAESKGTSEYPPLLPRPGLVSPTPRSKSRVWLRIVLATVGLGSVVVGVVLTVRESTGDTFPTLFCVGMGVFLGAITNLREPATPNRRELLRIVSEEEEDRSAPIAAPPIVIRSRGKEEDA